MLERILAMPGADSDEGAPKRAETFRRLLLMHLAAVALVWCVKDAWLEVGLAPRAVIAAGMTACFVVAMVSTRRAWLATLVAAALVLAQVVLRFPLTSNHGMLGLVCVCLLVVSVEDEADVGGARLALGALRWTFIIVCVWAGLQKVLHGTYLEGEFLAHQIATQERFRVVFGFLLGAEELDRITGLTGLGAQGRFALRGWGLALSNSVWALEMGLPLLLFFERTRKLGVLMLGGMLVAIELGAREFLFGGLFAILAANLWPGRLSRKVCTCFGIYYTLVVAALLWEGL